jgi:hypothetical protein
MDEVIKRLSEQTGRTRYQFLTVNLQSCFIAIDLANFELSLGNTAVVEKEVLAVEHGIRVIQRFLPEVSGQPRTELKASLAKLQSQLVQLKAELSAASPPVAE